MKRTIIGILVVMMILSLGIAFAEQPADGTTGNGSPKAKKLYSLNIIGVSNPKTADMDKSSGHVIFVPLEGKAKINLQEAPEGESFAVLDKNGTDNDGALFQLPDPGLDPYVVGDKGDADTISDYSVFVRPLGKPGGWATITTCADVVNSELADFLSPKIVKAILNNPGGFGGYASVEQVGKDITLRTKGKSTFQNVTAELLTIVLKVELDTDGDGIVDETVYVRIPIFDDIIENEYWEYDNNKLKLLQVRFYEIGTDVSENDSDLPPL